jgi:hypothetical protein
MKVIRHALAALLPCLLLALSAPAADTTKPKTDPKASDPKAMLEDTATRQAQLKRAFETFRTRLSLYANRLENGSAEDKQKAQSLKKAIKLIGELGTAGRFDNVIGGLTRTNADQNLDVLGRVVKDNKELRQDLQKILALLLEGDALKKLAERKARAKELLEKLKEVRDKQARLQTQTEMGKQEEKTLAKAQDKVTEQTKETLDPPENADEQDAKELEAVKKPVEDAIKQQDAASKQLKSGKPGSKGMAGQSQGNAVSKLDEAIKKLEELIRQLREEERQQKLADLLGRCKKMLAMQTEVRDGTGKLDADITKTKDGKPTLLQAARATKLADQELAIVREASAALKLVKAEDTAVVFAEVFEQVHKDMDTIHTRLEQTDVGKVTQQIEDDVIATLQDIIKALERAMQEPQDPEDAPRQRGQKGDRKLVNFLQQLKMILAMQRRINQRTTLYGKTYTGEQAPLPEAAKDDKEKQHLVRIYKELQDLASRQDRLSKVTREVSKQPEARQQ